MADRYRGLRPVYDRGCFRSDGRPKRAHESAIAAHNAVMYARRSGITLNYYQCRSCGHWHVGHVPRRLRKAS